MANKIIPRRLPPLPSIREVIRMYRLRALRQLSQNFLLDDRLIDRIVGAAGNLNGSHVCEVGPGPGGITRSIMRRNPNRIVLIERDERFLPTLEHLSEAFGGDVEILIGDVLSFNMEKCFNREIAKEWEDKSPNIYVIGNLPFNVSTPLIIKWLEAISLRSNIWSYGRARMVLTFQKEVAERITAPVLSDQRCRLSVMCQNWCKVVHKFSIPGKAFLPKPEVDCGVVHFTPLKKPVINLPFGLVEKVVRCIFSFRQKYSIKGAETLFPVPIRKKLSTEMYEKCELKPETRPFQLSMEEFGRLCLAYKEICDRDPRLYKYNSRSNNNMEEFDFYDDSNDLRDSKCLLGEIKL